MSLLPALTLILGGARSGKSRFAERLCQEHCDAAGITHALYLATAEARDGEMQERIRLHRQRRSSLWQTVEAPLDLPSALDRYTKPSQPVLIDCLTLWLSNILEADWDIEKTSQVFLDYVKAKSQAPIVVISNEVGLSIVPENTLARRFRDEAGRLNQKIATVADRVVFIMAGLPITLKG